MSLLAHIASTFVTMRELPPVAGMTLIVPSAPSPSSREKNASCAPSGDHITGPAAKT